MKTHRRQKSCHTERCGSFFKMLTRLVSLKERINIFLDIGRIQML